MTEQGEHHKRSRYRLAHLSERTIGASTYGKGEVRGVHDLGNAPLHV